MGGPPPKNFENQESRNAGKPVYLVLFMAPPVLGQSIHGGFSPRAHVRHNQLPSGTVAIP